MFFSQCHLDVELYFIFLSYYINNVYLLYSLLEHRKDCFTTDYFKGCVEVLQETDELELFKTYIKQLHGADPGI